MHPLRRSFWPVLLITLAGCSSSQEDTSAGSGQDLSAAGGAGAGAFTATGNFVSEDGLGRMRLDASGGDILVSIPRVNMDPQTGLITGKLKTVDGKTTLNDDGQGCSITLVGDQDSIKVTDESPACNIMDSDGLLRRTYVHEKADSLKGDYSRVQDSTNSVPAEEAISLSILKSGDSGLTFSLTVGGKPSLTGKTARMLDSVDLVWSDGKRSGCTLGIVLLAPNQIVVESEENCPVDQGTPHNYLGNYTRSTK
jgi:hypothetical protein